MATITRKELVEKLRNVKDNDQLSKNIRERITYTLAKFDKSARSVTNAVLSELANDISDELKALTNAKEITKPATAENSVKPALKAKAKAQPKEQEEEVSEEATEEKPKTKAKPKAKAKKVEPEVKAEITADFFPETIEHEVLGVLNRVSDQFTTMDDIRNFLNEGNTLYIAARWTKSQIKQFEYGMYFQVPAPKKGFENDLDLLSAVIVCDNIDRLWAMSVYTEAMLRIEEVDLEPLDGVRYSLGLEFELYTPETDA